VDEVALRTIAERHAYLSDVEARRSFVNSRRGRRGTCPGTDQRSRRDLLRQRAEPIRNVRLGEFGRNQLHELAPGFAASSCHEPLVVVLRQVVREQKQTRQMNGPGA
jgi:hypothetical protein